ncbi:MAG: Asp-tRNA(Asn)/Glu-tRNA(Gln) amidotransferase subunit GatB [Muricomes sp.]
MGKQYETVIGLEVHVELATDTKIFCGCSTKFGGAPNTHTCPVCTGMPGSLPILNKRVADCALALGLAANCQVNQLCRFDRKNYFYPDNPQNYQISQLYFPICHDGFLEIETSSGKKNIRIHEMHMEEDAGKLIHDEWEDSSLVDYNRSGVPLVEIVSEPDMRNSEEVIAYLEKLRIICQYLGVSDCKLQEGSMRVDVNLSVREAGSSEFGTRTEMKNLNSFKAITRAIENEKLRQIELLEEGKPVQQETRRWDDNKEYSYAMRSKEDAKDYRYFPDPDLPPINISDEWIASIREQQPELQEEKAKRYESDFCLSAYDASLLTQSRHLSDLYEQVAGLLVQRDVEGAHKKTANWFIGEVLRLLKVKGVEADELHFTPKHMADLIGACDSGEVNGQNGKEVFEKIFDEDIEPISYIEEHGLKTVTDTNLLSDAVGKIYDANPKTIEEYKSGKTKVLSFLIGQVMKEMKGKADPQMIQQMFLEKLQ